MSHFLCHISLPWTATGPRLAQVSDAKWRELEMKLVLGFVGLVKVTPCGPCGLDT